MRPSRHATPLRATTLAALALALAACADAPDLAPRPARLAPGGGPTGVDLPVTITGAGFFPRAVQSSSGGPATLDATHRAWLDGQPLSAVTWVDSGTLLATVPGDLSLRPGPHALEVENALGRRGTLEAAWISLEPAALELDARLDRSVVGLGQEVTLTVALANTGGTAIGGATVRVDLSGGGGLSGSLAAGPFDLDPGAARQVDFPLTASVGGLVVLKASAEGREAVSDRTVSATTSAATLRVEARAALAAALSLPSTIAPGAAFPVTMQVENSGQGAALAVTPDALVPAAGATATAQLLSGPTPASLDALAPGARATFTWSYLLATPGIVQLRGGASGTDAGDGLPVVAAPVDSNLGTQQPEVLPPTNDPLGDGTPVAALAVWNGALHAGPSRDGARFYRLDPASGAASVLGVEVAVDLGPTGASNAAWRGRPPATTFGAEGCAAGTTACGPGDEDGRGVLSAGHFRGDEWLLYAASSQRRPRYLYLSHRRGAPVPFSAVDLEAALPVNPLAPTAAAFASAGGGADRIYLALTERTANRSPVLLALATSPAGPWLDPAAGTDLVDLGASGMPAIGGGAAQANRDPRPRIEAMAWFRDRLYLASGPGLVRSRVVVPRPHGAAAGDWALVTPASPAWLRPALPAGTSDAPTPADRAVPALAAFGACGAGPCLFMARNVRGLSPAVQPQLWRCDPDRTGFAAACDALDWSLAAADASDDRALTQLGDPANGAVGVLLATGRYLYLGFDNAVTGVQLYRAEVAPAAAGDFRGRDGCLAGSTGCQGLGGNGLGLGASVSRLFGAAAVTAGGRTTVHVAAGDGAGPLRLFALPE